MNTLKNKVAVVTGGNSGIGFATVKLFLEEGAKVVFSGRRQEALDEAAANLTGDFLPVLADAASISQNENLIQQAVARYGKIDILFLNAGVAPLSGTTEITEAHYDSLMDINVKGPFFTVKNAIPYLNDGGVIVFNTSIVHQKGFENLGVYSATKAALRALTRVLVTELKDRKIRVVSVAPGPIETPIYGKMGKSSEELEEMGKGFAQMVPLGRFGTPQEVANTVLFLASDGASYINGVELEVDGGTSQV